MGLRPIDVQGSVPEAPEIARIQRPRPAGTDSDEGAADAVADAVQGGEGVPEPDAAEEEPGEPPDGRTAPWDRGGGAAADQNPDAAEPGAPPDGGAEDGAGPHIDIRI
jgi:hypothetical protein